MPRKVKIKLLKVEVVKSDTHRYSGNRPKSKTDGLTLLEFVRTLFDHNYSCDREDRLQDHEIRALVAEEFSEPHYDNPKKHYVSVWRNMYNSGRLHNNVSRRTTIAYRVNSRLQFTKSTGEKPLTVEQLCADYEEVGFDLSEDLLNEVKGYASE
jgi:hypothetical protein